MAGIYSDCSTREIIITGTPSVPVAVVKSYTATRVWQGTACFHWNFVRSTPGLLTVQCTYSYTTTTCVIEYVPSSCFVTRFRAAVSGLAVLLF